MPRSQDALRGVGLAAPGRRGQLDDGVLPWRRVFGVIVVALVFGEVDKHLEEQKERESASERQDGVPGLPGPAWSA